MNRNILFLLSLLVAEGALAKSSVKAEHMWERTSDKYSRQIYSIKYWQRQWNFGYTYPDEKPEEDTNYGLELYQNSGQVPSQSHTGKAVKVLLGKKINPELVLTGALGYHSLNVDQGTNSYSTARASGRLKMNHHFYQKNEVQLEYENDYHYTLQLASGSARNPLTTEGYNLNFTLKPIEKIRVLLGYGNRWVSDGVQRQTTEGSLLYGISPSWPWIWVGIGGEYISHSRTTPEYYSPKFFKSYGTRAEAAFPVTDEWSVGAAWNYSIIQEEVLAAGVGHYIVGNVRYGGRQNFNFGFNYVKILSQQSNSEWSSESYTLNCEYPF